MALTFDTLKKLSHTDLAIISNENIINTCIIDFKKSSNQLEILKFLLGKFVKLMHFSSLENLLFLPLSPEIIKYTHNVK